MANDMMLFNQFEAGSAESGNFSRDGFVRGVEEIPSEGA
jgi:hypothetical protein